MMSLHEKDLYQKALEHVLSKMPDYNDAGMKNLAQAYYDLARAGLYRELDPEKITPEMLDKLR